MSVVKLLNKKLNRLIFTTPSHNQNPLFSKEYKSFYNDDVSEYVGFDNLSCPKGQIARLMAHISEIFKTGQTFLTTQGATTAMLAAMKTLIKPMDKVLIARNCHKSVYNGLVLTCADVDWFMPEVDSDWGIYLQIDPKKLDATLKLNDYKVFIMTSPTYEGINSNIAEISEICRQNNTYLIVDESHGALYNFSSKLPKTAISQGADISVNSLHKTAGALNQTALLHVSKDIRNAKFEEFQKSLNLFQTTSPSYPLLKNIEQCIDFLNSKKGEKELDSLILNIEKFKSDLKSFDIEFYNSSDPTKILLKKKGISGEDLSNFLFDEFKIEDELNNDVFCLFLCGIGTTKSKLNKLKNALIKVPSKKEFEFEKQDFQPHPVVKLKPFECFGAKTSYIDKKDALLKISAKTILPYPPGIGVLYPGEAIQDWHLKYLDDTVEIIEVLR